MEVEKTFGETVRKLREEKQLPLRKVAEALGIDISMLSKIEKNHRKPTKNLIEKMGQYFNVSGKDLRVAFLSDEIAYKVLNEGDLSDEIFKVAEEKVRYLITKENY